jgi:glycosyltransferase involved in cell wall biosynthesis
MKFGYFGFPSVGGTFAVYRHLRRGLGDNGIQVQWVGFGPAAVRASSDPVWESEAEHGFAVGRRTGGAKAEALAFIQAVERAGFDGVFVNVLADRIQTNAVCYLKPDILRVMIVHNITAGTYAAARAIRDSVHATVCVSSRIRSDLISKYGFDSSRTHLIPNATDAVPERRTEHRKPGEPLRILFLGRLEDRSKGTSYISGIFRRLPLDSTLTIAGNGPDLQSLMAQLQCFGDRVQSLGAVSPENAQTILREHDVLLMPSRYEGLPIVLLEAMAKGCVPVASRISGVTDMLVQSGKNGFLFPTGNTSAAAEAISRLRDPDTLKAMSDAAVDTAEELCGVDRMAEEYNSLIKNIARSPPSLAPAKSIDQWRLDPGLKASLRTYMPVMLKNIFYMLRERTVN